MLKADAHYQGEHVQMDFYDSWEEVEKACIKLVDAPSDRLTAKNAELLASLGRLYAKLQKVVNEGDTFRDIFLAHRKLQYDSKELSQQFIGSHHGYHSAYEIDDVYIRFCQNQIHEMAPDEYQVHRSDPNNNYYELMKIYGIPVLFTPSRVSLKNVPRGLRRYEIRHDDEYQGIMCQLAGGILVNH